MKHKYRFHPSEYALGENEQFYSDMEAAGWRLVKRGGNLSKFEPTEPRQVRYRIEVSAPGFLEEANLSEGQLAVFADCGWEHVCTSLPLYIFRSPAGSGAPEFYADPAQQAETLKRMKRDAVWGWVPAAAMWGLWLLLYLTLNGAGKFAASFRRSLAELTPLFLLAGALLLQACYSRLRNALLITRTYRRMKRGVPLDHSPNRRRRVHRAVNGTLWSLVLLSALLLAVQLAATRSGDLPEETADPYLLLADLGCEGERTSFMNRDSGVTYSPGLLADHWDMREYHEDPSGMGPALYQDVYRLRLPSMAEWLAEALMRTATLSRREDFRPLEVPGLDRAWAGRNEVVAVKGDMAACVTFLPYGDFDPRAVCQALAEKWAGG